MRLAPSLVALLATVVLLPVSAQAGGGRNPFEEPDESEFFEFDNKLVTVASRFAQTPKKAPNVVSVIDARQIRERGYRTVSDALRDLPGAYVWRSNEGRHLVALRGIVSSDNNKVLLLVDGIPLYDGVYTHAWIDEYLPLHHVRQIELIEGPGSAVYGTNAFAGVINIVTMEGGDLKGGRGRVLVGSGNRVDAGLTAGDTTEVLGTRVSTSVYARATTQSGDGIDVTPEDLRDIRGEDPKRGVSLGGTVHVQDLTVRLHHFEHRHSFLAQEQDDLLDLAANDLDAFGLAYRATVLDARYDIRPVDALRITPRITWQRHDNPGQYAFFGTTPTEDGGATDALDVTTVETEKDTRLLTGAIDAQVRPHPDHVTVAGLGVDQTTVLQLEDIAFTDFSTDGEVSDFRAERGSHLRNGYAYAAHTWTILPQLEATLGGRLDKRFPANDGDDGSDDAFRLLVSPRVGVVAAPIPQLNAKVLYGRAFRHANVRETLVQTELGPGGTYPFANGSFDLRPEQVDTVDVEVEGRPLEVLTLRAAGSYSLLTVEIDKVTPPNQYQNLPGALSIATAEAEAVLDLTVLEARAAYTLTEATYGDEGPYAGRRQYEVPPHMVKGHLTFRADEVWSLSVLGEAYSARPRADWAPDSGVEDGDPFGLLHATLLGRGLGPRDAITVQATVRNLLDTSYETGVYRDEVNLLAGTPDDPRARNPRGFEGQGRSVMIGVEVGF